MCNANNCCRSQSKHGLKNFILLFIFINFVISFVAIFISSGNTDRYKEALIYLEQINNGYYNNYTFNNCKTNGTFGDETYCEINGKFLRKPSNTVSNQDLFKIWKKIEIAINISRTIITFFCFLYLYFFIMAKITKLMEKQYSESQNNDRRDIIEQLDKSLISLIIFLAVLITMNAFFLIIRILAYISNNDIGLYEEGIQNSFQKYMNLNNIFDIVEIILYSISIGFVERLKRKINKDGPPEQNVVPPDPNPSGNQNINSNITPQIPNPYPNINLNVNIKIEGTNSTDNHDSKTIQNRPIDHFH